MRNRKIRVLSQDIDLQFVDSIDDKDSLGEFDIVELNIKVKKGMKPQQLWHTLWHEIIHAGFSQIARFGLSDDHEEAVADATATIVTGVLRDYPWMAEIPE